jgi:hypothetical protein
MNSLAKLLDWTPGLLDFVRCIAGSNLLGLRDDHDFAFKMIWAAAGTSSATQSALLPLTSR